MNNILTTPVSGDIVNQYLCGGTFFSLMLRLGIVSDKSTGRKIADREVFKGLTEAVTGVDLTTPKNTLGIYTSYYRGCKDISYSTPLRDLAVAYQYHHTVMNNYEVAKRWMESFVRKFIDPRKKEILVRSILELINNDTNILPSQHFYVVNSETYMTKYQLIIEDSFDLASFFVGIMNFILTERLSSNHLGIDTINYWDRQNERQRGSISSSVNSYYFGASIKHDIHVIYPKDEPTLEKANPAFPAPMNRTPLDNYLQAIMADLTEVHTVINQGNPAKFDEIYVETNLLPVISDDDDPDESVTAISDITIQKLEEFGHRIKIVGIGGLGKTMLIRNIFIKQVLAYQISNIFPIFIEPRSFDSSYSTLIEYIASAMNHYSKGITPEMITKLCDNGNVILFFDGVDEMTAATRDVFLNRIDAFRALYPGITIIITSRPSTRQVYFPGFATFEAQPLTKGQAVALIKKVTYWDRDAKDRFVVELQNGLFEKHKEFCGIPLFLVILLATYRTYGSVPTAPHEFFEHAIMTMLGLHDTLKHGYKRRMYCSLDSSVFIDFFSEFCYRAYSNHNMVFSEESFYNLMTKVIENKHLNNGATAEDFLNDATEGICIMYKEARKFRFLHRSFLEYLTAKHMSKRIVGHYAALKAYWDKRAPGWEGDHTFDMLYAMKGEELDNLLFLPFFEEKLLKYGEGDSGYWQFLFDMYPKLVITNLSTQTIVDSGSYELKREVEQGLADGESTSFLFNFFKTEKNISHADEISKIRWSYEELRFFGGHYIERSIVEDENGDHVPYYYGDNPIPIINYQVNHNGLPKYLFTLRPKNIKTGTSEISNELYDKLISEDFPLKREYNELCRWVKSSRENLDSYSDYQSIIDSLC